MPILPTWSTWVPPHSSRLQPSSPMETTRTMSPYFSPNRCMAPRAMASSNFISLVVTARLSRSLSLTRSSTAEITDLAGALDHWKSKRRRFEASSEPRWVACGPSSSRSALCTMCVAVCERAMAPRRARSMLALTSAPTTSVPSVRRHWWTMRSLMGFCTSSTSSTAPSSDRISAWSASWPPASA